jgi:protocatechuate 3,4-dioxygenase beta subunit
MVTTAKLQLEDAECEVTEYEKEPWLQRYEVRCGAVDFSGGFDGNVAWTETGGELRPSYEHTVEEYRYDSDLHSDAHYRDHFVRMQALRVTNIDSHTAYEVECFTPVGQRQLHYFDVETGLHFAFERTHTRASGEVVVTHATLSDRRSFDGIAMATTMTLSIETRRPSSIPGEEDAVERRLDVFHIRDVRFNVKDFPDISAPEAVKEAVVERRIRGVVQLEGRPQAGVQVEATGEDDAAPVSARSDGEGRFELKGVRGTHYSLEAHGGTAWGREHGQFPARGDVDGVVIALEQGAGVRGVVRDAQGIPLERISLYPHAVTDAQGRYELRCRNERGERAAEEFECTVRLQHETLAPFCKTVKVRRGRWTVLDIVMTPGLVLTGRVVDERGQGVEDVGLGLHAARGDAVSADGEEGPGELDECAVFRGRGLQEAISTVGGAFTMKGLLPGDYDLSAVGRGNQPHAPVRVPSGEVVYSLKGSAVLTGHFVDEKNRPLRGSMMLSSHRARSLEVRADAGDAFTLHIESDEQGAFAFHALPQGEYELHGQRLGRVGGMPVRAKQAVTLAAGQRVDVTLRTQDEGRLVIAGHVTRGGAPLPNTLVHASSPEGAELGEVAAEVTDQEGAFSIAVEKPGTYRLKVDGVHHGPPHSVSVEAGDKDVRIELPPTVMVSGRVVDEAGAPVAEFLLSGALRAYSRDAAGLFKEPMENGGDSTLLVRELGYVETRVDLGRSDGKTHIELGDIVLRRGRRVSGRVVAAADGRPLPNAVILAATSHAQSGEDGRFVLSGLDAHGLVLTVSLMSFAPVKKPVGDDESEVTITLGGGASVTARALDTHGNPLQRAAVTFECAGQEPFTVESSKTFQGAVAGDCTASAHVFDSRQRRVFEPIKVSIPATGSISVDVSETNQVGALKLTLTQDGHGVRRAFALLATGSVPAPKTRQELGVLMGSGIHLDSDGVSFEGHAPPGGYTLLVITPDAGAMIVFRREIQVTLGETTNLAMALTAAEGQRITLHYD